MKLILAFGIYLYICYALHKYDAVPPDPTERGLFSVTIAILIHIGLSRDPYN